MTDLALPGVAYVFADWGMWKARCPRPGCTNAMALDRDQATFTCLGLDSCGFEAPVIWPADPQAIEALLAMRPLTRNQNWLPDETLADLIAENAAHDCLPTEWLAVEGRTLLLATAGDRVVGGLLHQHLEAAGRREIGA
jgi:hypothetical protein